MELNKGRKPNDSPWGKPNPVRYPMDPERRSVNVRFEIISKDETSPDGVKRTKGHFIVGMYNDGVPGELFIHVSKEGSDIHGWANCWSKSVSMLLQYGVDPRVIYDAFKWTNFYPNGMTNIKEAIICKSMVDMIIRYMEGNFPPTAEKKNIKEDDYDSVIKVVGDGNEES